MATKSEHDIDTAELFQIVHTRHLYETKPFDKKSEYDRIILYLESVLRKTGVITFRWEDLSDFNKASYISEVQDTQEKLYFLTLRKGSQFDETLGFRPFDVTQFNTQNILVYQQQGIEPFQYSLFFALKISFTNIIKMNEFLDFQMKNYFKDDKKKFLSFLEDTLLEHDYIVDAGKKEKAKKYIQEYQEKIKQLQLESKTLYDKNNLTIESIPVFNHIKEICQLLNKYIDNTQHVALRNVLSQKSVTSKIIFKGQANQLADVFKQLDNFKLITGCKKNQLINWIQESFQYTGKNNKVENIKAPHLHAVISGENKPCKNPIVQIIKDKNEILSFITPENKRRSR